MIELLPVWMFATLGVLLFTGFPVAWVLGGLGLAFGLLGIATGQFLFIQFSTLPSRIFGGVMESLILSAVPMFVFMGTMLERSGVARDLLDCLQVLLRRVPGGLALAVTLMGTILAATTGIIGASVVMMTLLALPTMLERRYSTELATGTIAASGTLGILIPPSIMLVIMADLLSRSVGTLFMAAVVPGFMLASLYGAYIALRAMLDPASAPRPPDDGRRAGPGLLARSFLPPVALITLVLGSILGGFATPTEAAGVGAAGATLLAFLNLVALPAMGLRDAAPLAVGAAVAPRGRLRLFGQTLSEVVHRTALTNAMIFGIFIGATLFSYTFRALGGEALIVHAVEALGLGAWGLLALVLLLVFGLGFFFDWIEITLIVLPVFAPVLAQMDFGAHVAGPDAIYWIAILVAINLQTSFLTPPFGFALFYLKAVSPPGVRLGQIYRGIIPFVGLQLLALLLVMAFPEIALWLPRAVLD